MLLELKRPRHTFRSISSLKIWEGPRYFLGIEIAHSKHGVSLSQREYACDLLQEASLLGTKPVDTPMYSNPDFWNDNVALKILKRHGHVKIEAYSDTDYARSNDDKKSTSGYCTYIGEKPYGLA
ncbi:hypothetical protein Sango_0309300 [Sesamum angolense]|uniref:Reverse transcriptase Ty1/copia-type domain-containing protein n=1 Tax=Sesamum angolense TaxID=2727404 RepID=A0AAE2C364_9LAMI|nr:hypothetical protein Sango_0309300 [Sesamum angolense]